MKNTVTIILVAALVVFSAYFTVRKVKDNAGFMVPEVDMQATVKETGLQAVEEPAVKTEKKIEAVVIEEALEKPAGDARPVENILPAAEETPVAATEKTELMAEDIVMEDDVKDALLSEIQKIIAAAEEAAVGTEEKIGESFTEEDVEEALPAVAVKPVEETEERIETLLTYEEIEGPVKDALHVVAEEPAEQVEERIEVSQAEGITEEPVKDALPVVVEAEKIIETLAEDEMIKEPVKEPLITAMEESDAETKEMLETLLAEEAIEEPAGDAQLILPAAEKTPGVATEKTEVIAVDRVIEENAEDITLSEIQTIITVAEESAAEVEEKVEVLQAEEVTEKPDKDALPAEGVTEEAVEEVMPAVAEESAVEVEEKVEVLQAEEVTEKPDKDALPAESVTEEAVEELLPAAVEGPSMEVEEKIRSLLMKDETGDVFVEAEKRIAVLSFDNFSNDVNALKKIMPGLKKRLREKGLSVVGEDSVSDFLCDEKIRSSSYISNEMLRKVRDKFRVKTILAGAVVSFSSGEDPQVGLLLRLIDSSAGVILWADYVSLSGDDFATVLGLGRVKEIDELIARVLDKLFVSFSTLPVHTGNESTYRIAVMPFQNKSRFSNAGIITMYMFLVELLKNDRFEPIEYGEVRKLIVDLRVRSKGELEYKNLEALSKALNIEGVLVGTVEQYSAGIDESSPPKVAINARLLDARNNRILWYNSHGSNGGKKIIAFEWGGKKSVDKVANGVVSELVEKMPAAKLHY